MKKTSGKQGHEQIKQIDSYWVNSTWNPLTTSGLFLMMILSRWSSFISEICTKE